MAAELHKIPDPAGPRVLEDDEPIAPSDRLVTLVARGSREAHQYRKLRHVVERQHREHGLQVVAVTSPGCGEGKTTTALNLAGALAQTPSARVLIVDADVFRPMVAESLGIAPGRPGLAEAVLKDGCGLAQTARHFSSLNLSVLLSGSGGDRAHDVLASPRCGAILRQARQLYDFVVIDTPPIVPLTDGGFLAEWVDGFIVVVAAHKTPRKALGDALDALDRTRILGVVFNRDDRPASAYYQSYGYRP
jgi:capsular exopolysaccharide synthesis family protein